MTEDDAGEPQGVEAVSSEWRALDSGAAFTLDLKTRMSLSDRLERVVTGWTQTSVFQVMVLAASPNILPLVESRMMEDSRGTQE
jgi:hypothetical protein